MPAAVTFIEDDGVDREATARVAVVLKGSKTTHLFAATLTHSVAFLALHTTRDMSVPETALVQTKAGLLSFDLDQIASIAVEAGNEEGRKQVLTLYEELTI